MLRTISTFLGALVFMLTASTAMAQTWLSTASGVYQGDTTEVFGGGFAPYEGVILETTDPADGVATIYVAADADGEVSFDLSLDRAGEYVVEAWTLTGGTEEMVAMVVVIAIE